MKVQDLCIGDRIKVWTGSIVEVEDVPSDPHNTPKGLFITVFTSQGPFYFRPNQEVDVIARRFGRGV